MKIAWVMRSRRQVAATLEGLQQLCLEGKYEEAEAGARALEEEAGRLRRRGRRLAVGWYAKTLATAVACAHGRGAQVLEELESLIAELRGMDGPERVLLLLIRTNRMTVLSEAGRHHEAEAEGLDILGDLTRLKHLTPVWRLELSVLDNLAEALCGQGRYEEAEAIARGNLPRAEGAAVAALHSGLVRSLNGQKRYDEALTEAQRFTPRWDRGRSGDLGIATAVALHGLGRRSEAEATVREALNECERFLHPDHPRVGEARTLLTRITAEDPPAPTAEQATH
ncbi:tetratricopeptide repeat protein [Streptomyces sp. CAI-85]|uniref:tetratricopeptide repeat protein n=1 Tax=Streptomyces sp. CAI-85 TaxID=1472662 RepID=UPI00158728A1|nr:tetratricopeptide repeat protein [Streptomyces sp. CAI-85]NUV61425.1 tetratricopeptide repeat protein [Streptomyces sp. CAI-85]